ncbi:aminopeptidase, partial [Alkalicoccobacillus plakortidis]
IHFYNTLFDENASSHLAFGQAYADNLIGSHEMSTEEKERKGMNHSSIHIDFMIGSEELNVFGVTEGGLVEMIMESGRWRSRIFLHDERSALVISNAPLNKTHKVQFGK